MRELTVFREEATSALAGFHVGPLSWSNWNLEMLVLWREGKRTSPRKTLGARLKSTTNSTHIWHWGGIDPRPHWWDARAHPC